MAFVAPSPRRDRMFADEGPQIFYFGQMGNVVAATKFEHFIGKFFSPFFTESRTFKRITRLWNLKKTKKKQHRRVFLLGRLIGRFCEIL